MQVLLCRKKNCWATADKWDDFSSCIFATCCNSESYEFVHIKNKGPRLSHNVVKELATVHWYFVQPVNTYLHVTKHSHSLKPFLNGQPNSNHYPCTGTIAPTLFSRYFVLVLTMNSGFSCQTAVMVTFHTLWSFPPTWVNWWLSNLQPNAILYHSLFDVRRTNPHTL